MKNQVVEILKSSFSIQKSSLEKSIKHLPSTETTNNLISISNTPKTFIEQSIGRVIETLKSISKIEKTRIEKILPISTQCGYIRSIGGGAAI